MGRWTAFKKGLSKQSTIHLRNQTDGHLTAEQISQIWSSYDELIALGERQYEPPSIGYPQGQQTLNELKKRRDFVLNCLDKPWLPHQNNPAERLLRPIKRHTWAAVTNRSQAEARAYCAFLTVTKTAELQGREDERSIIYSKCLTSKLQSG